MIINFKLFEKIYRNVGIEGYLVGKSRNLYIGTEIEIPLNTDNIRCYKSNEYNVYRFIYYINNKPVSVIHIQDGVLLNMYTLPKQRRKGFVRLLFTEAKEILGKIDISTNLSPDGKITSDRLKQS
jgi:hypothetical protein